MVADSGRDIIQRSSGNKVNVSDDDVIEAYKELFARMKVLLEAKGVKPFTMPPEKTASWDDIDLLYKESD